QEIKAEEKQEEEGQGIMWTANDSSERRNSEPLLQRAIPRGRDCRTCHQQRQSSAHHH
ncbi:MAG: hypothetical protein Q9181_008046, partial [Wetmoreana brouardii]